MLINSCFPYLTRAYAACLAAKDLMLKCPLERNIFKKYTYAPKCFLNTLSVLRAQKLNM